MVPVRWFVVVIGRSRQDLSDDVNAGADVRELRPPCAMCGRPAEHRVHDAGKAVSVCRRCLVPTLHRLRNGGRAAGRVDGPRRRAAT